MTRRKFACHRGRILCKPRLRFSRDTLRVDFKRQTKFMKKITTLAAALALCGLLAPAADWPRWGGNDPGRNMYSPETGLPDHFAGADNARVAVQARHGGN